MEIFSSLLGGRENLAEREGEREMGDQFLLGPATGFSDKGQTRYSNLWA